MKYGESTFDILYLLIAVIIGSLILKKARNRTERMMGAAGAGMIPMLGMLMLPKTICYIIIIFQFFRAVSGPESF